jgi:SPX domain protein involved in polyphosphate accumulation
MNDFLTGRYTMDEEFDALVAKGKKSEKEVEGMKQLANEIQYAIVTRKLRPGKIAFEARGRWLTFSDENILQPYRFPTSWKR